jgi:hypothetical protein
MRFQSPKSSTLQASTTFFNRGHSSGEVVQLLDHPASILTNALKLSVPLSKGAERFWQCHPFLIHQVGEIWGFLAQSPKLRLLGVGLLLLLPDCLHGLIERGAAFYYCFGEFLGVAQDLTSLF